MLLKILFTKLIMDLDQKLDKFLESMQELRESIRELRKSQAETSEQIKENGEQIQELRKSQAQTDEQMKRTDEQMKRTDEQMKRTDERMKKSDEKLERIGVRLGNMGITTGSFAEEFFYRSLQLNPRLGNIFFDSIERRYRQVKGGTDYDIVLKNGTSIGLIEVKYNAHPEHVREIKERKIKQFRGQVHEFPHFQLYFGLASMITSEKLIENAKEEGIFLLTQKGEHLEVVNQEVRSF